MSSSNNLIELLSAHPIIAIRFQSDIAVVRSGQMTEEEFEKRWLGTKFTDASTMYDRTVALLRSAFTEGKELVELLGWYQDLVEKLQN